MAREATSKRPASLAPVRPSAALAAAYRKRLRALIDEMHRSIAYWLIAAYRRNEPEMRRLFAMDQGPVVDLLDVLAQLAKRWQARFEEAAAELADYFATQVAQRSDYALRQILRRGGWSVKFTKTRAVDNILRSVVEENVSLIRSIPQQYLSQVEQLVMRSVQAGRDLEQLNTDLRQQHGVARRRAELIARDQNNKATAVIQRTRQAELGIEEAIWVHSGGGREPRPTHVKAGRDRVRYRIDEGWFDPAVGRNIWPGELINCRCVARPVVPGFS